MRRTQCFQSTQLALAAALLLAGCNGDLNEEQRKTEVPAPPIALVPEAAGEVDLVIDNQVGSALTDNGTSLTANINGAVWRSPVAFNTGTGVLEPFLRVEGGNNDFDDITGTEEGFNTNAADPEGDSKNDPHTHALALNSVPVVKLAGVEYREIILDANESNSAPDALFSIDRFDLYLCDDDPAAAGYDEFADFRNNPAPSPQCKKIYDLGGKVALASDNATKGSGNALDYQILIPNTNFTGSGINLAGCEYNGYNPSDKQGTAEPCGIWIILDTKMGGKGGDYVTGATFEEFSTILRPFVTVAKTAVPTFKRTYNWQIQKSVNPTTITLFNGQSQNATWSITVTPGAPAFTDSDAQVAGTITITNPSEADVTITGVTDVIAGYPGITPSCGVTFPYVLEEDDELVCTYSVVAPNSTDQDKTNTATVTLSIGPDFDGSTASATANFSFGAPSVEVDKDPPVKDNYNGEGEQTLGNYSALTFPHTYQKTYECGDDEGGYENTARVDLTSPRTDPTATANLTVECLDITVTKTAVEARTDTYNWLISKTVTPATWELFKGDAGTSAYSVTVTPNGVTPSGHSVSGVITITGDTDDPVYLQSLGDAISPGGFTPAPTDCELNGADIDGGLTFPYTLPADGVITCDYTQALPNGDTRTNTATVAARPTADDATHQKNFSGQAEVNFAGAQLVEVNKTVHVDDTYSGGPQDALVTDLVNPTTFNYNRTFTCDTDAGTHPNTATITETGQNDDASVTVVCRIVRVEKNAITTFDRDFNWDIDKSTTTVGTIELAAGQTYNADYSVVVTKSAAIDDNHHVTGTIRIAHNNTARGAVLNSLTDVVSAGLAATISGCNIDGNTFTFPGTVPVGKQLRCTYDRDLDDASSRTNTATAVQQNHSYSSTLVATPTGTTNWATGAVPVTFGAPTNVTDNCADVGDTYAGVGAPDENICASKTYNYTRPIVVPEGSCTDFTVDNTATVDPSHDPEESDNVSIPVDVQCPTGCTLTLGYWKTHNESFKGGAPVDETWDLLGALAEATGFFTTANSYPVTGPNALPAFTWFNVFWTPVGGNAYYSLAHQYMAAKLNVLNGADPSAASAAITTAEGLFANLTNTPAFIGALKGNDPLRKQFVNTAGILGSYNEGKIGPGHCTEDRTSSLLR